jgi:hypothetical protein
MALLHVAREGALNRLVLPKSKSLFPPVIHVRHVPRCPGNCQMTSTHHDRHSRFRHPIWKVFKKIHENQVPVDTHRDSEEIERSGLP